MASNYIRQGISQFRDWYSACLHKAPWLSSESMPHPICSMVYFPTVGSFSGKRVCEHSIRGAFLAIASLPSKRLKPPVTTRVQKPSHVPLYPFYSSIIIKTFQCISIIIMIINHYHCHYQDLFLIHQSFSLSLLIWRWDMGLTMIKPQSMAES